MHDSGQYVIVLVFASVYWPDLKGVCNGESGQASADIVIDDGKEGSKEDDQVSHRLQPDTVPSENSRTDTILAFIRDISSLWGGKGKPKRNK